MNDGEQLISSESCHLLGYTDVWSVMWTDVSDERITSIFRVEYQPRKEVTFRRCLGRMKVIRSSESHTDYTATTAVRTSHFNQKGCVCRPTFKAPHVRDSDRTPPAKGLSTEPADSAVRFISAGCINNASLFKQLTARAHSTFSVTDVR
jgi:hypothetical protein